MGYYRESIRKSSIDSEEDKIMFGKTGNYMSKGKYLYPRLSKYDFGFFRLGGAGLGNLLFTYGWAIAESKKYDIPLIWPTWYSIKLGPYLRHEKDKRKYNDLFDNRTHAIHGFKKLWILLTTKRISRYDVLDVSMCDGGVIEYFGMDDYFSRIMDSSEVIREELIANLKEKNKGGLDFDFSDSVSVHIRCGDFQKATPEQLKNGRDSSRLPIEWYADRIKEIREIVGREITCYIFSDGTDEELAPVLALSNVKRLFFGSAIADIIALSRFKLFIATGSTFSMWARYLGRMSVITYENQLLQSLKLPGDSFFECETADTIPESYHDSIKKLYE